VLLLCERRSLHAGVWVFKPLAATAFVGTAIAAGALDSSYGRWLLAGLAFCWGGDVLLIPRGRGVTFLAGIGSFLLGHVAYAIAFATLAHSWTALFPAATVMTLLAFVVLRWLWPHLSGVFTAAVPVYIVVIGVMVTLSASTTAAGGPTGIAIGAAMFAVSDVAVARDRLVAGSADKSGWGAWGLPLYFSAQLVLASTVARAAG
jgi:uncharacterized membrane protein YhhN